MKFKKVSEVIYHANCHDGLASAGLFYDYNEKANFHPYQHGNQLPLFENKYILIVDLSIPEDQLLKLMKNNIIYLIDHHLSTENLIKHFNYPHEIYYNKNQCGALNLWEKLHPYTKLINSYHNILSYVNDRDLWLNKLPHYQEVYNGLTLEDQTVKNWSELIFCDYTKIRELIKKGSIILENNLKVIQYLEKNSYIKNLKINNKTFKVIYCNSPILQSDLGNYLVKKYSVDFSAIFYHQENKTIFSLRGIDKINLNEIAKNYNGGGHFNASGCSVNKVINFLYDI